MAYPLRLQQQLLVSRLFTPRAARCYRRPLLVGAFSQFEPAAGNSSKKALEVNTDFFSQSTMLSVIEFASHFWLLRSIADADWSIRQSLRPCIPKFDCTYPFWDCRLRLLTFLEPLEGEHHDIAVDRILPFSKQFFSVIAQFSAARVKADSAFFRHSSRCYSTMSRDVEADPGTKNNEDWKIKMLYDGDCPLCMREVCPPL